MAGNDRNLKQRPSVPAKKASGSSKGGPDKHDGRDRIRPGTYQSQTKPAWDGPSVILKDGDD